MADSVTTSMLAVHTFEERMDMRILIILGGLLALSSGSAEVQDSFSLETNKLRDGAIEVRCTMAIDGTDRSLQYWASVFLYVPKNTDPVIRVDSARVGAGVNRAGGAEPEGYWNAALRGDTLVMEAVSYYYGDVNYIDRFSCRAAVYEPISATYLGWRQLTSRYVDPSL